MPQHNVANNKDEMASPDLHTHEICFTDTVKQKKITATLFNIEQDPVKVHNWGSHKKQV